MAEETLAGDIDEGAVQPGGDQPLDLADPQAVRKLGHEARNRFAESIDTTGKALAAVAGLGVFFFATGYFVEWQQMKQADLSPQETLPLIPKEQIAAAGVRELFGSIVFGGLTLALIAIVLVKISMATKDRKGLLGAINSVLSNEILFATAASGALIMLVVPLDKGGIAVALVVTGLLYYGLRLVKKFLALGDHAKFPLWRLVAAIAVAAVVLSTARQWEYPEPRPTVMVILVDGTRIGGTYIASDSDKIVIEKKPSGQRRKVIAIHRDEVQQMILHRRSPRFPSTPSLLDEALDPVAPDVHFTCIPLECRTAGARIGPSSFL